LKKYDQEEVLIKEGIKIKTSYPESPKKDFEVIVRFSKYIDDENEEDP